MMTTIDMRPPLRGRLQDVTLIWALFTMLVNGIAWAGAPPSEEARLLAALRKANPSTRFTQVLPSPWYWPTNSMLHL